MIQVLYSQDGNNSYSFLKVSGHAEYDDIGKDLVCAAVSSIVYGLMNALDENSDAIIREEDNTIRIEMNKPTEVSDHYFELVMYQLKTIEVSYPEYIRIERK